MIKRHYFYQIDTQESASKYGWGVVHVKSWFPKPYLASETAPNDFCKNTGRDKSVCKLVSFNRV